MGIAAYINNCKYIGIDKNADAIKICNKRKNGYFVSQSAVTNGNYQNFNNLEEEIKRIIINIKAIPVERNKGLDGIYSTTNRLIGIRFQRENESISEIISLMEKNSKEKPITEKIIIKTHDSDLFEIIPDDFIIIDSLEYKIEQTILNILNKGIVHKKGAVGHITNAISPLSLLGSPELRA